MHSSQNDDVTLKNVFKVSKLTTYLLDAFDIENIDSSTQISAPDPGAASRCTLSATEKKSLRGFVINLANAIRLQVSILIYAQHINYRCRVFLLPPS